MWVNLGDQGGDVHGDSVIMVTVGGHLYLREGCDAPKEGQWVSSERETIQVVCVYPIPTHLPIHIYTYHLV